MLQLLSLGRRSLERPLVRSCGPGTNTLVLISHFWTPRFSGNSAPYSNTATIVVLLASLARDLQRSLDRFTATCEAAGMRISTSKSKAMVLNRKKVECPLRVREEILPQMEEFKVAGLFLREGRGEKLCDREELGVEPLLLRVERSQMRWLGHLVRMLPGRRPPGRPRTRWRDNVSPPHQQEGPPT
ncbi:hypothetical protein D4764_21G0004860 [Takifugu flavidus]|uniref:Reverse transcriptase domain-containing protein n=1 Tax=Takifugu flavidus TaxID=433684 RepID=A0A5C6NEP4_9TELE|nr:hypothetical protein D4764_21G0004860 [Takifugu flavidus]